MCALVQDHLHTRALGTGWASVCTLSSGPVHSDEQQLQQQPLGSSKALLSSVSSSSSLPLPSFFFFPLHILFSRFYQFCSATYADATLPVTFHPPSHPLATHSVAMGSQFQGPGLSAQPPKKTKQNKTKTILKQCHSLHAPPPSLRLSGSSLTRRIFILFFFLRFFFSMFLAAFL